MATDLLDFVARNKDGKIVLIGEVKVGGLRRSAEEQLKRYLSRQRGSVAFGMVVDTEIIQIYRWDKQELSEPLWVLNTGDILRFYDPKFDEKPIFESYLTTLVEAWLRDLAYHWKSSSPPATADIEEIGLLAHLADGTTEEEVELDFVC